MSSVPEVAQAMSEVLGASAEQAATATGLVQRRSKLTGSVFTQTLVFGVAGGPGRQPVLSDPDGSHSGERQSVRKPCSSGSPPGRRSVWGKSWRRR